jgi:hypothetical protein
MSPLDRWTETRVRWILDHNGPNSLRVGPDKPLGSFGIAVPTREAVEPLLRTLLRHPATVHVALFGSEGILDRWRCRRFSEIDLLWIYAWHGPSLRRVLARHRVVLEAAGLSTDPKTFVPAHRGVRAPVKTALFDAFADAYGDTSNPGRTDLDLDPIPALRALRTAGHVDPSLAFFPDDWLDLGNESD